MNITEQAKDEIKKFKERKNNLVEEIENILQKIEGELKAQANGIRISIKYPEENNRPRLTCIELNSPPDQTYFTFQFPNQKASSGVKVIKENLNHFYEKDLKELLASLSIKENRVVTVEEIDS